MPALLEAILSGLGRLFVGLLVGAVFFYTGEILLFVLSAGYKKPRWDLYLTDSPPTFVLFTQVSTWIGATFWALVIVKNWSALWE